MPSTARILEILFYSMTAFIPWLMLALYPFRSRLRFSGELIAIPSAILAAAQIAADMALILGSTDNVFLIRLILILIDVGLCVAAIRAPLTEVAINTLMVLILAMASILGAKTLTTAVAMAPAFSWINTVILLALECVLVAVYFFARKYLGQLASKAAEAPVESVTEEPAEPAQTITEELPAEEIIPEETPAEAPQEADAILKSATRRLPIFQFSQKASAGEAEKRLQTVQYDNLLRRIDQSQQLRHDLDQQTKSMIMHLNNKDYDKLRASLAAMQERFPAESTGVCSGQSDLDAVLTYFLRRAERNGIRMTANVQLPGSTCMDSKDLTVLIGNLLDNALEACKAQSSSDRRITVSGNVYGQALRFVVENTYEQPVQQDRHGTYLSAKHNGGPGTGLDVVRSITERCGGTLRIDHTNGIFQVTVTLNT